MKDYTELVKALRETAKHLDGISRFPYDDDPAKRIYSKNMADAAAAIEALQAELIRIYKQLPKRGEWLNVTDSYSWYGKCSVCGEEFVVDAYYAGGMNYCPNCGADMRKMEVQE